MANRNNTNNQSQGQTNDGKLANFEGEIALLKLADDLQDEKLDSLYEYFGEIRDYLEYKSFDSKWDLVDEAALELYLETMDSLMENVDIISAEIELLKDESAEREKEFVSLNERFDALNETVENNIAALHRKLSENAKIPGESPKPKDETPTLSDR